MAQTFVALLPDRHCFKRGKVLSLVSLALSHHSSSRLNRTIGVRVMGREQRFCTRCSGQWAATAACVIFMLVFSLEVSLLVWMAVLLFLPMPALLDWITQTWGVRESNSPLRLLTGASLGIGVGLQVVAGVRFDWPAFVCGVGVAAAYAVVLFLLLRLRPPPATYMADLVEEATVILNGR